MSVFVRGEQGLDQKADWTSYRLGQQNVRFSSSSSEVRTALSRILSNVSSDSSASPNALEVYALHVPGGWRLLVNGETFKSISPDEPAPYIAEELLALACTALSDRDRLFLINGAVFESGGVGVAIIGEDSAAVKGLGLHLHARGWSAITFGYAFMNHESLEAHGVASLTSINSGAIDQLPQRYKSAIERSLWYDNGSDLTFYSVDPFIVVPNSLPSCSITHAVIVDGDTAERAILDMTLDKGRGDWSSDPSFDRRVRMAKLVRGAPVETCNIVENWLLQLPAEVQVS